MHSYIRTHPFKFIYYVRTICIYPESNWSFTNTIFPPGDLDFKQSQVDPPGSPRGGQKIHKPRLRHLLNEFKDGKITSKAVEDVLSLYPYEDIIHTKVDHHRSLRKGFPEVIYGKGKSENQILDIIKMLTERKAINEKIVN